MNREWVESRKAEYAAKAQVERAKIVEKINASEVLTDEDKKTLERVLDKECGECYGTFETSALLELCENHEKNSDDTFDFFGIQGLILSLNTRDYNRFLYQVTGDWMDRYLDSEPIEFNGDIIITDPCYIMRAEHHGATPITEDDWDSCNFGSNLEVLGFKRYMTRDTLYGDWGCTVYNTDTNQPIGEFCADAGLVSVFLLDEVLKYNPDFDYHKERTWTTTLIPNFSGMVQFVVEHTEGVYKEDSDYWKAGDKWEDFSVHVVGHGVDTKTGEPINFRSTQTSL